MRHTVSTYSWQRGSSKQSVLRHPRSGAGEVWSGPVVQVGKQGSKFFKKIETKLKQNSNKNHLRIELKSDKPGFQPLVVVSIFSIVLASKDAVKKMIERQIKYTVFMMELYRAT